METNNGIGERHGWDSTWKARLADVDDQIVSFFQEVGERTAQDTDELKQRIQYWWENQQLDPTTRAEFEIAKSDAKLFGAQVENRVTHLVQAGRIKLAKLTRDDKI